ncbi:hypothetical protein BU15DRAFT_48369 [Melanogaster broomeanus]|nr:hypothetical protein BU15DRAFT_48369 [Melanogaster broomeanus]
MARTTGSQLFSNVLRVLAIVLGQILIFVFACSLLGEELYYQCVSFDSTVTQLIQQNPRISTTVVTLIATALSLVSSLLFGLSVREAMRHKMGKPTSLIEISTGIALVKGSAIFKLDCRRYAMWSAITWIAFSWTTLLMPSLVDCKFDVTGTELDLASPAFVQLLQTELAVYSPLQSAVHDDSFPIIDIGGSLSGISAAGTSFALPGIFNFNGVKYNTSTGGVLPAIRDYAGSTQNPGPDGARLSFAGGRVLTNTTLHPAMSEAGAAQWLGIQRNFSVYQQGLTAEVTCIPASESQYQLNLVNNYTSSLMPSQGQDYYVWGWDSTANCNGSSPSIQQYVTLANSTNQPDEQGSGFLPAVVCPGQRNATNQSFQKFVIATQGYYKYSFLPSTVCEVTPFLTTVLVSYSSEIVEASGIVENRTLDSSNSELLLFLAGVANYEARQAQGTTTNSIGDALFSIYSSTADVASPILNGTQQVYAELENYWRGVVEFSATFLRSGYSAYGAFESDTIPSNMTAPINGTMLMLTMGWADRGGLYFLSVLPLCLVTILTILTGAYSITKLWGERRNIQTQTPFDVSDTLHLVTACAAGGLQTGPGKFSDFSKDGLKENEAIKLVLQEDRVNQKKLVVVGVRRFDWADISLTKVMVVFPE